MRKLQWAGCTYLAMEPRRVVLSGPRRLTGALAFKLPAAAVPLSALRFVGGSRENYKQKPDNGYADAVIDPPDHEALARIGEKAGAMSHKAHSRDQSENSEGSQ